MAMTKKERAEFDAAIMRAETLAALRWTEPVTRDVPIPLKGYSTGWDFNSHAGRVWLGWSGLVSHGTGERDKDRYTSGSQGGRAMFSAECLALQAMRHEMEMSAAQKLRQVDQWIARARDRHAKRGDGTAPSEG